MLNAHPCIRSHGETLRHRDDLKNLWKTLASPTKTDDPKALKVPLFACGLKGFFTPGGPGGLGPKGGARHDFSPANPGVFAPVSNFLSEADGIGVVIWLRRNALDRYLSFLRESHTGKPHCQSKAGCDLDRVRQLVFQVPLPGMVQFLDTAAASDAAAEAMLRALKGKTSRPIPVLEVQYEDLISDEATAKAWWSAVLQFVGVSRDDVGLLQSEWRKQITKTHKELITNYDQVHEKLKSYKSGAYLNLL
eukprot:CAMPEP_0171834340 /NCGR_PEP_ID=MMETSP0992-20121227/10362_2 /TAXON_ID=483369 /ORGANISM="non described non described, Strain CCMP2098" /LENGTH=248 /DNA_ID=CAMNT_0012450019 /DNA_START=268 /DNA_END=1014 /DNA_ORIENTATION=-